MEKAPIKKVPVHLIFSVIAHVCLLVLVGGTVIVQQVIPNATFMQQYALEESPETLDTVAEQPLEEMEIEELSDPSDVQSDLSAAPEPAGFDSSALAIETTDSYFNISAQTSPILLNAPATGLGRSGSGSGAGSGNPGNNGGTGQGLRKIKLFNTDVETYKMGVLMDVSGSAANYIAPALKEVEKNFTNAPIVLVGGCGIGSNISKKNVEISKARSEKKGTRPDFGPLFQRISDRTTSEEVKSRLSRIPKQDNVWGVYLAEGFKDSTVTTKFGFEHLINQGVDSIYWFADFADAIDPEEMLALTRIMKEKKIKLIAHNFSGGRIPDLVSKSAQDTGGNTIRTIPGK